MPMQGLCPLPGADRHSVGAVLLPVPPLTFSMLLTSLISLQLSFYGSF